MKKLTPRNLLLGTALGILVPLGVLGANLTTPNIFTSGTPIKAAEVNANFAAIQAAVNSKLDTGSALSGGTRIQHTAFRSADGAVVDRGYPVFDKTTNTYCYVALATDSTWRCLPIYDPTTHYYSNSSCTGQLLLPKEGPYNQLPGWPVQSSNYTSSFAAFPDGGFYYAVSAMTPYTGPVYDGSGGTCVSIAVGVGTTFFTKGAAVAPSTFAEFTPITY